MAMYLNPVYGKGHVRQRSSVARIDFHHETLARDEQELQVVEPLLEEEKEHSDAFAPVRAGRTGSLLLVLSWALSLVLASVCTYVFTRPTTNSHDPLGSFAQGYATDLDTARSAISLQTQRFHGSLDFKARHGFIPSDSPSTKYIGATPAVDVAWDELAEDRYFLLSDDEARRAYGTNPSTGEPPAEYWNVHHGGYVAGLDVLHTLHCLNHLRTTLYPDVYPQDPQNSVTHGAHCIDHMRQLAMCYSDLTPIPTQWFAGIGQNYINSSQVHTCRNFWAVREWSTERFNGSTAVKPRNRDGSPRENFYAPWSP
ncbi:hypothetical protein LTR85_003726 [Meristemomyces frigidus]|nr:hypothetical protein LTR85_003726 [Meristemomyces frigidus]